MGNKKRPKAKRLVGRPIQFLRETYQRGADKRSL